MTVRHHTVQVPATSANLGPGYDAYGIALDLHLAVRTVPRSVQAERVEVAGDGAGDVTTADDNLVWRAFVAFCEHHDVAVPDVAMRSVNRIPLERGLGSSSAAIVAGLVLGRALTAVRVGDRELVSLAAELEGHADNVAPALLGGLVVCATDDTGAIVVRRVNPAARLRPIVLVPTFRQSTSEARSVLPSHLDVAGVTEQAARAGHVLGALAGVWPVDPLVAGDRLHEPARVAVMGRSGELLQALRDDGLHAWLSGAGPSVAVAARAVSAGVDDEVLARCESLAVPLGFAVLPLAFDLSGARVCPDDGCGIAGTGGCAQCPRERL